MTTAIFAITRKGLDLAERLRRSFPDALIERYSKERVVELFPIADRLIFIMATGIVVRTLAPLLCDKKTDPPVVVIDEQGRHVISLVSGHLGGANELAQQIAALIGGEAVITTASDVNNLPSIDLWARENDLVIENAELLPAVATRFINTGSVRVYTETDVSLPDAFVREADPHHADMLITRRERMDQCGCGLSEKLYLRPKDLVLGIGCNSGTSADEIETVVRAVLTEHNLSFLAVQSIATIDIKATEPGLAAFALRHAFPIAAFTPEELNTVQGVEKSAAAMRATGAQAVAEPAALLASGTARTLVPKQKSGNVTVAIALLGAAHRRLLKGKLSIVGTGPGNEEHMTAAARKALAEAEVVVGYGTYLDLILHLVQGKEIVSTGMTEEIDRCRKAIELAHHGKKVAIVSGGDPGIYAMAGLVFELLGREHAQALSVEVIPGISALNAGAALLGAPLMHDFAAISLSDRLTPWEMIEKRLNAAAAADFVIVLYNPKSKGRPEHINRAVGIISKQRRPGTPVGLVKAAMRENEQVTVTDLEHMLGHEIDMQTTVIIGNSHTFVWNGRMITPRGYEQKYG